MEKPQFLLHRPWHCFPVTWNYEG